LLKVDTHSSAYEAGYWTGPLVLILLALALVVWGARSLRSSGKGVVRVVIGAVLTGVLALGYTFQVVDEVFVTEVATASTSPSATPTPTPTPEPSTSPTKKPKPKPVTKKFKPKPIPDPGPARRYGDCNDAIDAYNAARFEIIKRARVAWVDGALSAMLSGARIVVANTRCFEDEMVAGARTLTFKNLNQAYPQISDVPFECRQIFTDAYRLLGLASGMASASDGDVNLGKGIDVLRKRHPECITERDVREMKKVLAEELPAES